MLVQREGCCCCWCWTPKFASSPVAAGSVLEDNGQRPRGAAEAVSSRSQTAPRRQTAASNCGALQASGSLPLLYPRDWSPEGTGGVDVLPTAVSMALSPCGREHCSIRVSGVGWPPLSLSQDDVAESRWMSSERARERLCMTGPAAKE